MSHAPDTATAVIELPKGSRNFVDECRFSGRTLHLLPHDPRPRGFAFDSPSPTKEHRIELQVCSSNTETIVRTVRFLVDGVITDEEPAEIPGFEDVEFSPSPPPVAIKPVPIPTKPAPHHQA